MSAHPGSASELTDRRNHVEGKLGGVLLQAQLSPAECAATAHLSAG